MERLGQVQLAVLVGQHGTAARIDRGLADQVLGEVHQPAVVRVGRVELHHGELGVVARAHPFVAEVAVDLEHTLEAADDQALQVQLGRDAHEHLHVQRIVVRDERLGRGAARDRVQHRRFHFHEAGVGHMAAQRRDRVGAGAEGVARFRRHDQVDIALAVLHFLVGQAVELVRQRAQRLGQQAQLAHLHRQLALVGAEQLAAGADDVAQVPVLERGVDLFADLVARDVELDLAAAVLHGGEAGLAHHALEHHAAGDRDFDRAGFERGLVGLAILRVQRGGLVGGTEIVGEGHALLAQRGQLFAPLRDDLVLVDGGRVRGGWLGLRLGLGGIRFGHDVL
ncbi:hypothetical protein D3C72_952010 [compost metagenome]